MNVRGVRNIPCETKPGKRAPTVELCESDEQYIPLNDGLNWKGDPNATLSGQGVPQYAPGLDPRLPPPQGTGAALPPGAPSQAAAPVSAVPYDPATGEYCGIPWPESVALGSPFQLKPSFAGYTAHRFRTSQRSAPLARLRLARNIAHTTDIHCPSPAGAGHTTPAGRSG